VDKRKINNYEISSLNGEVSIVLKRELNKWFQLIFYGIIGLTFLVWGIYDFALKSEDLDLSSIIFLVLSCMAFRVVFKELVLPCNVYK
jgi:hypothetical protein